MKPSLKSLLAGLAVACAAASCSGGGSSTSPSSIPSGSTITGSSSAQTTSGGITASSSARVAESDRREHERHPSPAPSPYALFGDAKYVHPGHNSYTAVEATSTGTNAYGGVDFSVPANFTLSQLQNLSTDYRFTVGTCGLGSPRFSVAVTSGTVSGNIFVYIGPPPSYTGCPPNVWTNTGNLVTPASLVDDSQLPAGTFYDPYAAAQAKYGTYTITDIALVVDGPHQTVQFDNTMINQKTYTYENSGGNGEGGGGGEHGGGHGGGGHNGGDQGHE